MRPAQDASRFSVRTRNLRRQTHLGRGASRAACPRGAWARSVCWRSVIVPTLRVGMPLRTLRVRSRMWRRCVDKLQRYPRHALGSLNPQSVPFVTRSVTGGMPTRSDGQDQCRCGLMYNAERGAWVRSVCWRSVIVTTLCVVMPPGTLRVPGGSGYARLIELAQRSSRAA